MKLAMLDKFFRKDFKAAAKALQQTPALAAEPQAAGAGRHMSSGLMGATSQLQQGCQHRHTASSGAAFLSRAHRRLLCLGRLYAWHPASLMLHNTQRIAACQRLMQQRRQHNIAAVRINPQLASTARLSYKQGTSIMFLRSRVKHGKAS
jgi:hypothetical protein